MSTTTIPNPSVMLQFAKPAVAAAISEDTPTASVHDGIVKAKHLEPGQTVRAWLHDGPKGTERTVESKVRSEDGSMVTVTFTNLELTPAEKTRTYKAAYRFYDESLAGTTLRPAPATHLTHRPFESLESL